MGVHIRVVKPLSLVLASLMLHLFPVADSLAIGPDFERIRDTIQQNQAENKKEIQGKIKSAVHQVVSGMPREVLDAQGTGEVKMASLDQAVEEALRVAGEHALPLIDIRYHDNGKTLRVPADYPTIRQAIAAAAAGDTVLVSAGVYHEQIVMKEGVRLLSDDRDGGAELVPVNKARLRLPLRAVRTIIDGTGTKTSKHGMIDFEPGITGKTVVDGFTIRNLPPQDHHLPGHAHGLNVRGAGPVIMNCYITDMGSTGIGNHVVYHDQAGPMESRDFRYANIKHFASAVIYNNIITGSLGLGIGCNHFSSPTILGNEIFNNNDAELGSQPSPGIGSKHGAHGVIIGNIVHDNPGGGILSQDGEPQGRHPVDRATHPTIIKNVVYDNGSERPGISAKNAGSADMPVIIRSNYVYNPGATGVALNDGSTGIIEENMVHGSNDPGIAVVGSTAVTLNRNQVSGLDGTSGVIIIDGSHVLEMVGNKVEPDEDAPPYLLEGGSIVKTIPR